MLRCSIYRCNCRWRWWWADSGSRHRCRRVKTRLIQRLVISPRLLCLIPTMTYTWYEFQVGDWIVRCQTFRKWRYGARCHFGCSFLLLSLHLYVLGSQPSTNGIGTGLYLLQRYVKWRWCFPVRRINRTATIWYWVGVVLMRSYVSIRWTVVWVFHFLSYSCTGLCSPGCLSQIRGIM